MISPAIISCAPAGGGPPSYTGPLDLVPGAVVAYSQRAMAAAWVSNAITIRRDSDDATQSFATTTSNAVDPAAVSAFIVTTPFNRTGVTDTGSHDVIMVSVSGIRVGQSVTSTDLSPVTLVSAIDVGALTVTLTTLPLSTNPSATLTFTPVGYGGQWLDQSGHGNDVANDDVNAANLPRWEASESEVNNKPAFSFSNNVGSPLLATSGDITFPNGAATIFMVQAGATAFNARTNFGPDVTFQTGTAANNDITDADNNEAYNAYANVMDETLYTIWETAWDIHNQAMLVDGVELARTDDFHSGTSIGSVSGQLKLQGLSGYSTFVEVIAYPSILSAPNRLAIRENIAAYYGITLA